MSRKPLVIIVSGAPGSGKTTLASRLAHYLNLPHVERDRISGGLEYTLGGKVDRVALTIPTYYALLDSMMEKGLSFVTDGTLYRGISEADIKKNIVPYAFVINIHASAKNEKQRFIDREASREGRSNDWVQGHLQRLDDIYEDTAYPLELDMPLIRVDSNDEYDPSLAKLALMVAKLYEESFEGNASVT